MRAAAIFGLGTSLKSLDPFRANTVAEWSEGVPASSSDADAILIFGGDGTIHRHLRALVRLKLPVLVVAQNRLGCLNHAILTVRSVAAQQLRCVGLVLNSTEMANDIAGLTNADILKRVLDVPLLAGLGENLMELPVDWRLMLNSTTKEAC